MAEVREMCIDGLKVYITDFQTNGVVLLRSSLGVMRGPDFSDDQAAVEWALNLTLREYLQGRKSLDSLT